MSHDAPIDALLANKPTELRRILKLVSDHVQISAGSWVELRKLALSSTGITQVSDVSVEMRFWRPPTIGWMGRLGFVPGLVEHTWRVDGEQAFITLRTAEPTDLGLLLSAMLPLLLPHRTEQGSVTADVHVRGSAGEVPMLGFPLPQGISGAATQENTHVRTTDATIYGPADVSGAQLDSAASYVVEGAQVNRLEPGGSLVHQAIYVDPLIHRPTGRGAMPQLKRATWASTDDGLALIIDASGEAVASIRLEAGVRPQDIHALRSFTHIEAAQTREALTTPVARVLVQLSALGLIVETAGGVTDLVAPPLQDAWQQRHTSGDALDLQLASLSQRRLAHQHHASHHTRFDATVEGVPAESVSILLSTRRMDRLDHVLGQLARLDYPSLEVVVVAHTDVAPTDAQVEQVNALPFAATVKHVPSSVVFGAALGVATSVSSGTLVTKVDDDDYYGPNHVWDLVLARRYSGAALVGKPAEFVYLEHLDKTFRRSGMAGERFAETAAGGTMLMSRADLESVGGWRPVPWSVDRAVIERVLRNGGLIYTTHGLGYTYVRHTDGHTWDLDAEHFLRDTTAQWNGLVVPDGFPAPGVQAVSS